MANNNEPTHYMEDLNNVRTIMQDDDFVPTNARVITHRHQVGKVSVDFLDRYFSGNLFAES